MVIEHQTKTNSVRGTQQLNFTFKLSCCQKCIYSITILMCWCLDLFVRQVVIRLNQKVACYPFLRMCVLSCLSPSKYVQFFFKSRNVCRKISQSLEIFLSDRIRACSLLSAKIPKQKKSVRHFQLFRLYLCCLWIDLVVLHGFATQNSMRKPFMMVRGVKKLSLCYPVDLVNF